MLKRLAIDVWQTDTETQRSVKRKLWRAKVFDFTAKPLYRPTIWQVICTSLYTPLPWSIRCRYGIVPQTGLHDHCDKLAVRGPRSTVGARRYCQLSWPTTVHFMTLRASTFVELNWLHFDDRSIVAKSRVGAKFQREVPLLWRYSNFLINSVEWVERSCQAKTSQTRSAVSIEFQLMTDGHRRRRTRTCTELYSNRAIASRG